MLARRVFQTFAQRAPKSTANNLGVIRQNTHKNNGRYNFFSASSVGPAFSKASSFGLFAGVGLASLATLGWLATDDDNNEAYAADKVPIYGVPGTKRERSFIAIKPDGVHRNLAGEVIHRFESKGYKLVAIKVIVPTKQLAEKHYADLSSRPFFGGLVKYFSSGPVVAMVWEGKNVIAGGRKLVGATDPNAAEPGTVRGDHAISIGRNIIHGSDSPESAKAEISLWFKDEDIAEYELAEDKWIYEN